MDHEVVLALASPYTNGDYDHSSENYLMEFASDQQAALDDLGAWIDDESSTQQVRTLMGYAGTGKTTLAKHLAAQSNGMILFAAYTGKAAYVMRTKGCANAQTIHSLIYRPAGEKSSANSHELYAKLSAAQKALGEVDLKPAERMRIEGDILQINRQLDRLGATRRPMFTLNEGSDLRRARCLILDECSMVDDVVGADLESFGVKILALGDPAQLPPVGAGGRYTNRRPDHLLTQVHRQARESGILRMATDIREGRGYARGGYGADARVLGRGDVSPAERQQIIMDGDQLLVGKNMTRHKANWKYREILERTCELPQAADKVVCLRNDHELGILNGSLWRVHESVPSADALTVSMTISSEEDGGVGIAVDSHAHHFLGKEDELKRMMWGKADAQEFDYGYALTVHKAQGSQWDSVVLFDESGVFRADAKRWLYTGVTRAAKQLTVLL